MAGEQKDHKFKVIFDSIQSYRPASATRKPVSRNKPTTQDWWFTVATRTNTDSEVWDRKFLEFENRLKYIA